MKPAVTQGRPSRAETSHATRTQKHHATEPFRTRKAARTSAGGKAQNAQPSDLHSHSMGRATFRTRTAPQDTPCPSPSVSKNVTGERADRLRTSESANAPLRHCRTKAARAYCRAQNSRRRRAAAPSPRCAGMPGGQGYSGRSPSTHHARDAPPPRRSVRRPRRASPIWPAHPDVRSRRHLAKSTNREPAETVTTLRCESVPRTDVTPPNRIKRGPAAWPGSEPCGNGVPSGEGEGRRSSPEAAFRTGLRASGSG